MKFQNPILKFIWTDMPKAICPFNFSKVGGIITCLVLDCIDSISLPSSSCHINHRGFVTCIIIHTFVEAVLSSHESPHAEPEALFASASVRYLPSPVA